MIYYAYFHTVMKYDIHLWGNSLYSIHIFKTTKQKVLRMITSTKKTETLVEIYLRNYKSYPYVLYIGHPGRTITIDAPDRNPEFKKIYISVFIEFPSVPVI